MTDDDDFGMPPGFGDDESMTRTQRIKAMGDTELLETYARLHHPSLIADSLLALLESEMRERGLTIRQ